MELSSIQTRSRSFSLAIRRSSIAFKPPNISIGDNHHSCGRATDGLICPAASNKETRSTCGSLSADDCPRSVLGTLSSFDLFRACHRSIRSTSCGTSAAWLERFAHCRHRLSNTARIPRLPITMLSGGNPMTEQKIAGLGPAFAAVKVGCGRFRRRGAGVGRGRG
jgi:hypothetical protein